MHPVWARLNICYLSLKRNIIIVSMCAVYRCHASGTSEHKLIKKRSEKQGGEQCQNQEGECSE